MTYENILWFCDIQEEYDPMEPKPSFPPLGGFNLNENFWLIV